MLNDEDLRGPAGMRRLFPVMAGAGQLTDTGFLTLQANGRELEVKASQAFLRGLVEWCDGTRDVETLAELGVERLRSEGFGRFVVAMLESGVLVPSIRSPAACAGRKARGCTPGRSSLQPTDCRQLGCALREALSQVAVRSEHPGVHVRIIVPNQSTGFSPGVYKLPLDASSEGLHFAGAYVDDLFHALDDPLLLAHSCMLLLIAEQHPLELRRSQQNPRDEPRARDWVHVLLERARTWSASQGLLFMRSKVFDPEALRAGSLLPLDVTAFHLAAVGPDALAAPTRACSISWADTDIHGGLCIARASPSTVASPETFVAWGRSPNARTAVAKALGEFAERQALRHPAVALHRSAKRHQRVIASEMLVRYAEEQLARLGVSDHEQRHDTLLAPTTAASGPCWVEGTEWISGTLVCLPAEHVHPSAASAAARQNGRRCPLTSSGCAADADLEIAITRASCELIERDAFARLWLAQGCARRIRIETAPGSLRARAEHLAAKGCEVFLLCMQDALGPAMLVVIRHTGLTFACVGAACEDTAERSLEHAFIEAEFAALTRCAGVVVPPMRLRQVRRPTDHANLYATEANFRRADVLVGPADDAVSLQAIAWPRSLRERLAATSGARPLYWVELTRGDAPCDLQGRKLRTVRTFIPGCIPLAFGYDALPRGMVSHPVSRRARFPHPLA